MFPLFAPNPRCAAGFPLLSGLGGQFLPKFQVSGRRGTSEALMGFSSRSVILSVAEGSFCHPGCRTLSDPGTVQDSGKQAKFIIVLVCRKIFSIENHELTLKPLLIVSKSLWGMIFFLLLHPASEEGVC